MDSPDPSTELLAFLRGFITEERWMKFKQVLAFRTRYITVVLEDIYQSQNASAVLRTCDLTGIQDVHIIENKNKYDLNPDVTLGSNKWISMLKYNQEEENTLPAFNHLRKQGYLIVATSPHKEHYTPESIPLDKPLALVFGTEKNGLSQRALDHADAFIKIPMYGFTESYNISVSAALLLQKLTERLRDSDVSWKLTDTEQTMVLLSWCRQTIRKVESLEKKFYDGN